MVPLAIHDDALTSVNQKGPGIISLIFIDSETKACKGKNNLSASPKEWVAKTRRKHYLVACSWALGEAARASLKPGWGLSLEVRGIQRWCLLGT